MVGRYFGVFAGQFFDGTRDFWKCFVDVTASLFACEKEIVQAAIDAFAFALLYDSRPVTYSESETQFDFSESISGFIESEHIPRLEVEPAPVRLYVDDSDEVRVEETVEDGQFICDLPGFMLHSDELDVANGILPSCLAVTNHDVVVDMAGSSFRMAPLIARSFHYNAIVRLYKCGDEPHAGIFGTRPKGPLFEEKGKKGVAIGAGQRVILPFDGELPYPVPKIDWKDRSRKPVQQRPQPGTAANREKPVRRKPPARKAPVEANAPWTLLSAFADDFVPALPVKLLTEREMEEATRKESKNRSRSHRFRHSGD
jgi:hypothetical protein